MVAPAKPCPNRPALRIPLLYGPPGPISKALRYDTIHNCLLSRPSLSILCKTRRPAAFRERDHIKEDITWQMAL